MLSTMDETRFRILDTLSRGLGRSLSISELTNRIKELHGTAYYANIYDEIMSLASEGIIGLEKIGTSSIAILNFKSYLLIDTLAEIELKKKHALLRGRTGPQMLLLEFDTYLKSLPLMGSICMSRPEKNIKLNRMEFLILLRGSTGDRAIREHRQALREIIQVLQKIHNLRIDCLTLADDEFLDLLKSEDRNPLKDMLADKIAFINPQEFWIAIREALMKGVRMRIDSDEINPMRISEHHLVFNLARFGYTELGREIKPGELISIEYIISSILMGKDVRRIEAAPVIIAKNKVNYNVLTFLSQKYKYSDRLLGLLRTLYKIKPSEETKEGISTLESMHVNEMKADEDSIREKMRLYNAT
jgi:hypothetical protein